MTPGAVANEVIADRPPGVPAAVVRQVLAAKEVRVVAPMLTTRLESWTSDLDDAARAADERMSAIVTRIGAGSGRAIEGTIGDEDPLQAIADALATFPANALILATHTSEGQNRRERRLHEKARTRFALLVTEMQIDRDGLVVSIHEADDHA